MAEMMTLDDALARYKQLTDGQGCSDGGCLVQRPTGMHTNGGCRCSRDYMKAQRVMHAAQIMADAITAHLAQPAQAVDRAERAEALLREVVAAHTGENIEGCDMSDADVARITAHLSENSRG